MVGHTGSPTRTVYMDVTMTQSTVKVKVMGLLNVQQLAQPCMLAAMTAAPCGAFWFVLNSANMVAQKTEATTTAHILKMPEPLCITFGHTSLLCLSTLYLFLNDAKNRANCFRHCKDSQT